MDSPLKHHFESAERPDCLDVSPERLNPMTAAQLERELEAALEAMTEEEYDPAVIDAYLDALDRKAPTPDQMCIRDRGTAGQGVQHLVPPPPVKAPHPVDMGLKIPLGEEPGQGVLLYGGHGAGVKPQRPLVPLQQRGGKHHIADAQGGRQRAGKGIHIDHPARPVDALKGRDLSLIHI